MARQSAEARAQAALRDPGAPIAPPADLSEAAAGVWLRVVASKPVDWFDGGNIPLLETYCEVTAQARFIASQLAEARAHRAKPKTYKEAYFKLAGMKDLERRIAQLGQIQATLATKLRLSVQHLVELRSRKLTEKGPAAGTADPLLGGSALWGERTFDS